MTEKLGWEGKLYRNTGTFVTPTWTEIVDVVQDVTTSLEKIEATRVVRNDEWERILAKVKRITIEATLVHVQGDTNIAALRDAFVNNTLIDLAVADGAIATAGTEYWRAECEVQIGGGRAEPVSEGMSTPFTFKPSAQSANKASQPTHVTV